MKLIIVIFIMFLTGCAATTDLKLSFDSSPVVTPFFDGYWVLKNDLIFRMTRREEPFTEAEITVPAGFVSDLASIPFPASIVFSKTGRYSSAGLVHDYLYWVQPCGSGSDDRKTADQIIKEALKAADRVEVRLAHKNNETITKIYRIRRSIVRNTIKYGVYIGGWSSWNENRELRKKNVRSVKKKYIDKILPGERWKKVEDEYGEKLEDLIKQENLISLNRPLIKPSYCSIFDE